MGLLWILKYSVGNCSLLVVARFFIKLAYRVFWRCLILYHKLWNKDFVLQSSTRLSDTFSWVLLSGPEDARFISKLILRSNYKRFSTTKFAPGSIYASSRYMGAVHLLSAVMLYYAHESDKLTFKDLALVFLNPARFRCRKENNSLNTENEAISLECCDKDDFQGLLNDLVLHTSFLDYVDYVLNFYSKNDAALDEVLMDVSFCLMDFTDENFKIEYSYDDLVYLETAPFYSKDKKIVNKSDLDINKEVYSVNNNSDDNFDFVNLPVPPSREDNIVSQKWKKIIHGLSKPSIIQCFLVFLILTLCIFAIGSLDDKIQTDKYNKFLSEAEEHKPYLIYEVRGSISEENLDLFSKLGYKLLSVDQNRAILKRNDL